MRENLSRGRRNETWRKKGITLVSNMIPTLSGHFSIFGLVFLCATVPSENFETMDL